MEEEQFFKEFVKRFENSKSIEVKEEVPYNWEEVTDKNGKIVAYKRVLAKTVSTGD